MPGFGDLRRIEAGVSSTATPGGNTGSRRAESGLTETTSASMQGMADFVNSFGFIIFFLILVLGLSMTLGQKAVYAFLWLVLLGMVFTGWPKIEALIRRYV